MLKNRSQRYLIAIAVALAVCQEAMADQPYFCRGIHNIHFPQGSSVLPPEFVAQHSGSPYAECLRCVASGRGDVIVETYASGNDGESKGNEASFLWLAVERSNVIRDELMRFGYDDASVKSISVFAPQSSERTWNAHIEYHSYCDSYCWHSCNRLKEDIGSSPSDESAKKQAPKEVSFSLHVQFPRESSVVPAESVAEISSRIPCLNSISPVKVQLTSSGNSKTSGWDGKKQTVLAAQRVNSLRRLLVSRGMNDMTFVEVVGAASRGPWLLPNGQGGTIIGFVGMCKDESSCLKWCKDASQ